MAISFLAFIHAFLSLAAVDIKEMSDHLGSYDNSSYLAVLCSGVICSTSSLDNPNLYNSSSYDVWSMISKLPGLNCCLNASSPVIAAHCISSISFLNAASRFFEPSALLYFSIL